MKFWDIPALFPLCLKESKKKQIQDLVYQDGDLVAWWGGVD
jgi:hypothetical protein